MNAVDAAKNLIKSATEATVKKGREIYAEHGGKPDSPGPVSMTILSTPGDIRAIWTDPMQLSRVLGDVATVTRSADGEFRWKAPQMSGDIEWTTALDDSVDGTIRLVRTGSIDPAPPDTVDSSDDSSDVARLCLSPASNDLGTRASLQLNLPIPDLVAKTAAFTLLYRTRALLQTGEIPTLRPLPAARPSDR